MSSEKGRASKEQLETKLKTLAEEISADLSQLESTQGKQLLSDFVSELFLNMAKQGQRESRQQRQAEGIAAAKARGVRFGRARKPLPDNFTECYEAWQSGQMTQAQAAERCGVSRAAFYRAAARLKQGTDCSV